jgi:uncharacterized membrane protein
MGIVLGVAGAGVLIVLFIIIALVAEPIENALRSIGDWLGDHQIAILIAIVLVIGAIAGWISQHH